MASHNAVDVEGTKLGTILTEGRRLIDGSKLGDSLGLILGL